MEMIYHSPMALAAVTIAALALGFGLTVALRARRATDRRRLRETLWTVAAVLLLCGLAVAAVTQRIAR